MLDRKTTVRIAMIDEFGMPWIPAHTIEPCRRHYHSWAVTEQTGWRMQSEDCATLQLRTEHEIAKQKEDTDRSSIIGTDCIRILGSCLGRDLNATTLQSIDGPLNGTQAAALQLSTMLTATSAAIFTGSIFVAIMAVQTRSVCNCPSQSAKIQKADEIE